MSLPTGIILLWHGAIVDIPAGFVLCDGNNGTPDLRDKFVAGASVGVPPGTTGGNATHVHTFTGDSHNHFIPAGTDYAAGTNKNDTTQDTPATGTTNSTNHLPPFYALAYIMKT